MASRRSTLISSTLALALAGGYGLYLATAQSAPPELAQTPMNISNVIKPALIMAVDDSGSMNLETLFQTTDGALYWGGNGTSDPYSFYNSSGVNRNGGDQFNRLFAFNDSPRRTQEFVPPIDNFGVARSHLFNPGYYNPGSAYLPWRKAAAPHWPNATPTAAQTEPRSFANAKTSPVFNLTAVVGDTLPASTEPVDGNPAEQFDFRNGMVIPAGTRYRDSACGGVTDRATFGSSTSNQTVSNTCTMWIEYFPSTYFLTTATSPDGNTGGTLIASAPGGKNNLYKFEIKPANYAGGATGTAYTTAIQNFANWFQYYRNRRLATVGAMTHALESQKDMRIGYFEINDYASATPVMNDVNIATERAAMYTEITSLSYPPVTAQGTPNRQAVARIGQQFDTRTGVGAPIVNACQKNAGLLFTDGFSNSGGSATATSDGTNAGDSALGAPFQEGAANTMADIVSNYYQATIGPTTFAPNKVKPQAGCPNSKLDCRDDLHMNFYGITLGALANLYGKAPYVDNPGTPEPLEVDAFNTAFVTAPAWQGAGNDNPVAVDEIWHATINGRGKFVNAVSPQAVTDAMRSIISGFSDGASPAGTIGVTGSRVGTGSLSVFPRYESLNTGTDWYGQLTAETVTANILTGATSFTTAWEASARLAIQGATGRTINFGRTGSNVVPTVSAFSAANVTMADLCSTTDPLNRCTPTETTMSVSQAVGYLRGDRSLEGTLRTRTSILGDIINSSPVLASPNDDYGYRGLGGTLASTYSTYLASKKAADRPLVFVGANDGMLHVFDGRTTSTGGDEVYAYIPATALGHMGNLLIPYKPALPAASQDFKHTYYVDGPVTVSDAYINGAWKTIMVGTTGAGGRSVFALDVTDPSAITVLWEVNNLITGNTGISNNIGYALGKPVIVPFKDGAGAVSWKVIFGNGYNSTNQQARLFVVDAGTGAVTTIAAVEATVPAYNGLGNVVVVDRKRSDGTNGRDGYSDTVYAADQNGAVWKFDLLSNALALGTPLYIARDSGGNRQSITGGLTAATGPSGGVMVYFGSGSFSFTGDPAITSAQTIYGILDTGVAITNRSQLLAQTVGADVGSFRATSDNAMPPGRQGWYLDLPAGERFVGNPRIESGIVFFPSYQPSANTSADCSVSGVNWLYGLKTLTGGAALSRARIGSPTGTAAASTTGAVALVTGGTAPVKDVAAMTTPRIGPLAAGATQAEIDAAAGAQCSMVIRVAGAPPLYLPRPCGRQSWRQVR